LIVVLSALLPEQNIRAANKFLNLKNSLATEHYSKKGKLGYKPERNK
jgi:hypothetical protein